MSVPKDFFDSLDTEFEKAEKREEGGDTWKPEAGDQLKGIFLNVSYVKGDYGWQPVAVIRNLKDEASIKVWCSSGILREQVENLAPAPGTPIAIRYDGTKKSEKGRDYKVHVVAMPEREEGDEMLGREYWQKQEDDAKAKHAEKQEERKATVEDRPDEAPF